MTFTDQEILQILQDGKLALKGEFLWGSNHTFLVEVQHKKGDLAAVYKPTRGQQPLWDFPQASLARREVAAYLTSEALGWCFVPPTVLKKQAPFGVGSLQMFIDYDVNYHYFTFEEQDRDRLRQVVVFDLVINNADRKGSHVMIDPAGKLWLIDHGLCFHMEDKLRTVIWDFIEEPLPGDLLVDLQEFIRKLEMPATGEGSLKEDLLRFISGAEVQAMLLRSKKLVGEGRFPAPDPKRRSIPWPEL